MIIVNSPTVLDPGPGATPAGVTGAVRFAFPLHIAGGRVATVAQDSEADIAQSVALLLTTRPGERRSNPGYGLPDPVFGGVDLDEVTDVIAEWEPRADPSLVEQIAAGLLDQLDVHPVISSTASEE